MFKPQLSSIANHGFLYTNDGKLYGFGNNEYGQLGLGHNEIVNGLQYVMTDPTIRKIVCTRQNTLILKQNGNLFFSGFKSELVDNGFCAFNPIAKNIADVDATSNHIAILSIGMLGLLSFELGTNTIECEAIFNDVTRIFCTRESLYFVDLDHRLLHCDFGDGCVKGCDLKLDKIKGIYETSDHIFCWHDDKISILDCNLRTLFRSDNICYVTAGADHLLIYTGNSQIYGFLSADQFDNCQLISDDTHILGCMAMGDETLLYVDDEGETSTGGIPWRRIICSDIMKNNSPSPIDFFEILSLIKLQPLDEIFPFVVDEPTLWVKIFGAGTVCDFNEFAYKFCPQNLKWYVKFLLFCVREKSLQCKLVVPKYIRIEILKVILN